MGRRERDTTQEEREEITRFLYERLHDGELRRSSMSAAATRFGLHRNTIGSIWRHRTDLRGKKKGRVGRKKKYVVADVKAAMENVAPRLRQTIRAIAAEVGMPKSSFADLLRGDEIRRVTTRIHPELSPKNKLQRLEFVLQFVSPDEKWFFIDKDRKTCYVTDNEKAHHRTAQSKRFLIKVMFLVAVARPRFDTSRSLWFNGLIGLWPCVETQSAKRNSKNRLKGALVTVTFTIDRIVARRMLINQVIPAIKSVWPGRNRRIYLQQDNAGPHCLLNDAAVAEAGKHDGWDIALVAQPPNSPDLNVLDLGYFASIQALQRTKKMASITDLIAAMEESYRELDVVSLDNVFVTLMSVMEQILLDSGGNEFSVPHIQKEQRRKSGEKLVLLECGSDALSCGVLARHLETLREIFE